MWISPKESPEKSFPARKRVPNQSNLCLVVLLLLAGIFFSACGPLSGGPLQTETRVVELEGAENAQVEIKLGAGRLRLEGGSRPLLEGAFTYNIQEWRPEVDYSVTGYTGRLVIQQPSGIEILPQAGASVYDWNLRLNNQVPMQLSVMLGAGEGVLHVGDLNLTALSVTTGAGSTLVDLRKNWQNDLNVEITGGVGEVTLQLPSSTGVRLETSGLTAVNADDLIKEGHIYTNQAFDDSGANLFVAFQAGLGALSVEVGP